MLSRFSGPGIFSDVGLEMRFCTDEVFIGQEFPRANIFNNVESFGTWLSMGGCFTLRPIVQELMPEENQVSVAVIVLQLWYRHVKKMDPRVSLDVEPVEAVDTFVNLLVQRGFRETRTLKQFLAALNGSEGDDLVTGVF